MAKRVGYVGKGLLYAGLCFVCASILFGSGTGGGDEKQATARVLEIPLGRWLVAAVGAGFLIAAGYNAFRAVTRKFEDVLQTGHLNRSQRRVITVAGAVGHLARTVVFGLVGWFLIKAAWEYDPQEAIGLDGALSKLAAESYGRLLLGTAAAGLLRRLLLRPGALPPDLRTRRLADVRSAACPPHQACYRFAVIR